MLNDLKREWQCHESVTNKKSLISVLAIGSGENFRDEIHPVTCDCRIGSISMNAGQFFLGNRRINRCTWIIKRMTMSWTCQEQQELYFGISNWQWRNFRDEIHPVTCKRENISMNVGNIFVVNVPECSPRLFEDILLCHDAVYN